MTYRSPLRSAYRSGHARLRNGGRLALALAATVALGSSLLVAGPPAVAASDTVELFTSAVKPKQYSTSTKAAELGVRFSSATDGEVVALQFYRGPKQKRAYKGSLWAPDGRRLASAVFPKSSKAGWQIVNLSSPVSIQAGRTYVASYFDSNGRFGVIRNAFTRSYTRNGLTVATGGGVSKVSRKSTFPTTSYRRSNYLVDVVIRSRKPPVPTVTAVAPPTVTATPTATPTPSVSATTATPTPSATASTGCAVGEVGTGPNCVPAPPAPVSAGKRWTLSFNDEFNGTGVDSSKWANCFDWNYGSCTDSPNQGREHYHGSQNQVSGGAAHLVAEPMNPPVAGSGCYQGSCTYKSGLISTARRQANDGSDYRFSFTYGYVESRVKLTSKSGFFSAFWMLPNSANYSYDTELDIAEVLGGNPNTVFMTYHYNGRSTSYTPNVGNGNNGACQAKDYTKDFVRLGVDWQADHIAWYIDGVKCGQFNGNTTTIENGPMHLIMEVMVDNQWQRDWNMRTASGASDEMQIDYVRVYQQR